MLAAVGAAALAATGYEPRPIAAPYADHNWALLSDPKSPFYCEGVANTGKHASCQSCLLAGGGAEALPAGSPCGDCARRPLVPADRQAAGNSGSGHFDGELVLSERCLECFDIFLISKGTPSPREPHLYAGSDSADITITPTAKCRSWNDAPTSGWGCCPSDKPGCQSDAGDFNMLKPGIPATSLNPHAIYQWTSYSDCAKRCEQRTAQLGQPICCYGATEDYQVTYENGAAVNYHKGCWYMEGARADHSDHNSDFRRAINCDPSPPDFKYDSDGDVTWVNESAGAYGAGLRVGMRISKVNGHAPSGPEPLDTLISDARLKGRGRPFTLTVSPNVCQDCIQYLPALLQVRACLNRWPAAKQPGCSDCADAAQDLWPGLCSSCLSGGTGIACRICRQRLSSWRVPASCAQCMDNVPSPWPRDAPCETLLPISADCHACGEFVGARGGPLHTASSCGRCLLDPGGVGDPSSDCGKCWDELPAVGGQCGKCRDSLPPATTILECMKRLPLSSRCRACAAAVPTGSDSCFSCTTHSNTSMCATCWSEVPSLSGACTGCAAELPVLIAEARCPRCLTGVGLTSLWVGAAVLALGALYFWNHALLGGLRGKTIDTLVFASTAGSAAVYTAMAGGLGTELIAGHQFLSMRVANWLLTTPLQLAALCQMADRGIETVALLSATAELALVLWLVGAAQREPVLQQLFQTEVSFTPKYPLVGIAGALFLSLVVSVAGLEMDDMHGKLSSWILLLCWIVCPAAWAAADYVPVIFSADAEAVTLCVADVCAKLLFGFAIGARTQHRVLESTLPTEHPVVGAVAVDHMARTLPREVVGLGDVVGGNFGQALLAAGDTVQLTVRRATVTQEIGWYRDYDTSEILEVVPNSAADRAGVRPGMRILMLNGRQINSGEDLVQAKDSAGCTFTVVAAIAGGAPPPSRPAEMVSLSRRQSAAFSRRSTVVRHGSGPSGAVSVGQVPAAQHAPYGSVVPPRSSSPRPGQGEVQPYHPPKESAPLPPGGSPR
eukprot:TRINITY_DN27673_c0_g1_i1.p1 TRINITY_DN27673_c0_g1~~TRINITY_DN27673_c0_g1_i1.p1  ORF type:complete len:1011 (+),score=218.27 TRINITY_DN27673_c0_g1_i1:92-3124(+)